MPLIAATTSRACRVAAMSCARNTRAPNQAATAVAARVPDSRSSTGMFKVSPTKSLRDMLTSTGQPVTASSPMLRVSCSECQVFLPKSCVGSSRMRSRSHPDRDRPLCERRCLGNDVGDHVVVRHPMRIGTGRLIAHMAAHQSSPPPCRDDRHIGVATCPGVVDEVCARCAYGVGHVGAVGVDADHQVGVPSPGGLDERRLSGRSPHRCSPADRGRP